MNAAVMFLVLLQACISLVSCRSAGGPAQRVGHEMDRVACTVGGGIVRAGHSIKRAAR